MWCKIQLLIVFVHDTHRDGTPVKILPWVVTVVFHERESVAQRIVYFISAFSLSIIYQNNFKSEDDHLVLICKQLNQSKLFFAVLTEIGKYTWSKRILYPYTAE